MNFLITEIKSWWLALPAGTTVSTTIAALAMLATLGQWHIQRKHNRLMARPKLDGQTLINWDLGQVCFSVTNNGAGPAIIKEISISIDGEKMQSDDPLIEAVKTLFPTILENAYGHHSVAVGSYIRPSQTISILTITSASQEAREEIVLRVKERAVLLAKYESIYEESFDYDSRIN